MIPAHTRVYVATKPIDMRRSFDGLSSYVASTMARHPSEGGLFVFFNRARRLVKVLFWDASGVCVFAKRLHRAHFRWSFADDEGGPFSDIDTEALMALLNEVVASRRRSSSSPVLHLVR